MSDQGNPLIASTPIHSTHSRLTGYKLGATWAFWTLLSLLVLGLVISGIPIRHLKVQTADPDIRNPEFRDLIKAGVQPEVAAAYDLGVSILVFAVLFGGGVFLFFEYQIPARLFFYP